MMNYKFLILSVFSAMVLMVLSTSCKKTNTDTPTYFLTSGGAWILASQQVFHYVGDSLASTDTINVGLTQQFIFNNDNTCTYSNYHSIAQNAAGSWQFNSDSLTVQAKISCKDSVNGSVVTDMPFSDAEVDNVGQYSLVLKTGYLGSFYTPKTVRKITRYAFVHSN